MVQNANLSWNLTNVSGASFLYVIVGNTNPSELANLYQVSLDEIINGNGTVTINGLTTITELNFFGITPVPDEANTGALLLLAVSAALLTYIKHNSVEMPEVDHIGASPIHKIVKAEERC
jgi:hypothetical protein